MEYSVQIRLQDSEYQLGQTGKVVPRVEGKQVGKDHHRHTDTTWVILAQHVTARKYKILVKMIRSVEEIRRMIVVGK